MTALDLTAGAGTTGTHRILIVGYGDLGKKVANALVLDPRVAAVGVTGRDPETVERDANLLRFTAMNHGWTGDVSSYPVELQDHDAIVSALQLFQPTLVLNTASVQSWRRLTELPKEIFAELDEAQFGPWLPAHLAPARSLMQAVRTWDGDATVVNAAFPDAVGPVLAAEGLAPTIGAGNVANVVPAVTWSASRTLGLPTEELEVRLVAQHYYSHRLPRSGDAGEGAAEVEIRHQGTALDLGDSWAAIQKGVSTFCRRTGGIEGQSLTASSVLRVVRGLMSDEPVLVHAPSPHGRPGGYPVLVSRHSLELSLPEHLDEAAAVAVNERGQWADGVESIDSATGVATIRADKLDILARRFAVDTTPVRAADAWERAHRLHGSFVDFLEGTHA